MRQCRSLYGNLAIYALFFLYLTQLLKKRKGLEFVTHFQYCGQFWALLAATIAGCADKR